MKIGNIITGHLNNALNLNRNISEERMKICKVCPIYSPKWGGLCCRGLYLDLETGKVSTSNRDGYIRGCGCLLPAKTSVSNESCPAGKW